MPNTKILNKCEYCGLRQVFPPDTENLFPNLRALYDTGIIKQSFSRRVYASIGGAEDTDRDEFCLVSRPEWRHNEQPCDSWQLDVGLSTADCLSLHITDRMHKLTISLHSMTWKIVWLTVVITVLTLLLAIPEISKVLDKIGSCI